MVAFGSFEAKTHLARLLERAQKGEEIVITKHGTPVAKLTSANPPQYKSVVRTFAEIDALRRKAGFGAGTA